MTGITIAQLQSRIGQEIGVSDWVLVDQAMIDRFADATGDHQAIHVDPERARQTPFGSTIAHGFLLLSLMPLFQEKTVGIMPDGIRLGLNYGANRLRFTAPVRAGSRVRGRFRLIGLEEKRPGQFQQTNEFIVEIEGEEQPALISEWIVQYFM